MILGPARLNLIITLIRVIISYYLVSKDQYDAACHMNQSGAVQGTGTICPCNGELKGPDHNCGCRPGAPRPSNEILIARFGPNDEWANYSDHEHALSTRRLGYNDHCCICGNSILRVPKVVCETCRCM